MRKIFLLGILCFGFFPFAVAQIGNIDGSVAEYIDDDAPVAPQETNAVPTPSVPVPTVPAPSIPAQSVPAPSVPVPALPASLQTQPATDKTETLPAQKTTPVSVNSSARTEETNATEEINNAVAEEINNVRAQKATNDAAKKTSVARAEKKSKNSRYPRRSKLRWIVALAAIGYAFYRWLEGKMLDKKLRTKPQTEQPSFRTRPEVSVRRTPQPRREVRTVKLEEFTDDMPNLLVENVAPDNTYEVINALRQVYPSFDGEKFLNRVKSLYEVIEQSLATGNLERIKSAVTPALYEQYKRKLSDYERLNQELILQKASADRAYFFAYRRNRFGETLSVVVDVQETKYSRSTITGMVVNGKKDAELDLQYFYIFKNVQTADGKHRWLLSDGGLLNVSMDYGSGGVFIE